jgi:type II secretory pathway pseudopilin PulG
MLKTRLDDNAVEMIPIRMLISIGIIAAISLLIAIGYNNATIDTSDNIVKNQCATLQSQLYSMITAGTARDVDEIGTGEGTRRVQTFNLPSNLQYLSFGVDPDKDNNGILETGLDEDGSVIYYKINGGNKKVIWLSDEKIRFREGVYDDDKELWVINQPEQGYIATGHGESTLVFELIKKQDRVLVLIQATDSYDPSG